MIEILTSAAVACLIAGLCLTQTKNYRGTAVAFIGLGAFFLTVVGVWSQ